MVASVAKARRSGMPSIPRINDDPKVAEAQTKLRALGAQLEEVEARLKTTRERARRVVSGLRPQARYGEPVPDPVETAHERAHREAVAAVLDGRPTPASPPTLSDIDALEWKASVLRDAFAAQSEVVRQLQGEVAYTIQQQLAPLDREMVSDILTKAQALADALDAAMDLRNEMIRSHIGLGSLPELLWFANKIGSRRNWSSPVNALARVVAQHIGRDADYPMIPR